MRSRLRQGWYNVWGWTSYRVASNCLRYFQSSKIDGRKGYTCSLLLWMLWKSCWWVYVALLRSVAVFHIFLYSLVIFFSVFPTLNSWPKKSEEVFWGKFRSKAIVDRSGTRLQAKDVATLPHEDTGPAIFFWWIRLHSKNCYMGVRYLPTLGFQPPFTTMGGFI